MHCQSCLDGIHFCRIYLPAAWGDGRCVCTACAKAPAAKPPPGPRRRPGPKPKARPVLPPGQVNQGGRPCSCQVIGGNIVSAVRDGSKRGEAIAVLARAYGITRDNVRHIARHAAA
jgi:hypothetical protein